MTLVVMHCTSGRDRFTGLLFWSFRCPAAPLLIMVIIAAFSSFRFWFFVLPVVAGLAARLARPGCFSSRGRSRRTGGEGQFPNPKYWSEIQTIRQNPDCGSLLIVTEFYPNLLNTFGNGLVSPVGSRLARKLLLIR